ncbi:MAG: type II toxin-antitoxin system HicB family antitoxin [Candidatus Geothermincolia bacterium]
MRFDILLMRTDDHRFSAVVPALRDWFTFGDSEDEVLTRARGAIYESFEGSNVVPDIFLICSRLNPGH